MPVPTDVLVSLEEYLTREREGDQLEKSEYRNGETVSMPGAGRQHVLIVTNIVFELETQLRHGPCEVYSTDLRVRAGNGELFTYPDVTVVCEGPRFLDGHHDTWLNPALLIEVLSTSTREGREVIPLRCYDRGEKFARYRSIETLKEYVLVDQQAPHIERFARQPRGEWLLSETSDRGGTLELTSIDAQLSLAEMYHKVDSGS